MRILIFLLIGFVYLFGNIDNLIGSFESDYQEREKKISKSKMFNKNMVMKKKAYEEKMPIMYDTPSINHDIKNQQYNTNQEDISNVINQAIEEYMDGLIPFVIVVSLFLFIVLLMYIATSTTTSSNLKHKINVLENTLSEKLENLEETDNREYNTMVNAIKKIDIRLSSMESVVRKLMNDYNESHSLDSHKKTTQNKKTPIRKSTKKPIQQATENKRTLYDSDDDEGLSLDDEKQKKTNSNPLKNLTGLDMDIGVKQNKKAKMKEMEDFSVEDFDE